MAAARSGDEEGAAGELPVAIIGAGFAGLCMGIKLKRAGHTAFTIFEAADDVGGTWRANTYPGCACDIPSVLYGYSFEPYPWTQHYSGQQEIHRYQKHCCDRYGLWPHIRLNTRVTQARYDDQTGWWTLTDAAGGTSTARAVVLALGGLVVPSVPEVPGLREHFKGAVWHSATWDHTFDLRGKRVGVVGTGASAIQIIPTIQPMVASLAVFQRTPPWVLPRRTRLSRRAVEAAQCSRWYAYAQRLGWFWFNELAFGPALVRNDQRVLGQVRQMALAHLRGAVADADLAARLTPNYSPGCKRLLPSDEYYPALCKPNVHVVTSAVKEVLPGGAVVTADGSRVDGLDALVFATGFDLRATFGSVRVVGRGGAELNELLARQPESAYLGLAVPGFPNLFTVDGPNTGLGHNSIVFMIECGVNFIAQQLGRMRRERLKSLEVRPEPAAAFNDEMQRRLRGTVWASGGCRSWYVDAATGRSWVMWPGLCVEYWFRTLWPRRADWLAVPAAAGPAGGGAAGGKAKAG